MFRLYVLICVKRYLAEIAIYILSLERLQNITVDILIPPSFVKTPTNQICPNGRTARFECQAQGLPVPQIYWLKDSSNITINGNNPSHEAIIQ